MSRTFRRRKGNRFNAILLEHHYVGTDITHKNRQRYPWRIFTQTQFEEMLRNRDKTNAVERARFYADGGCTCVKTAGLKQDSKEIERRHVRDCLSRVDIVNAEEFDIPRANTLTLRYRYS